MPATDDQVLAVALLVLTEAERLAPGSSERLRCVEICHLSPAPISSEKPGFEYTHKHLGWEGPERSRRSARLSCGQ